MNKIRFAVIGCGHIGKRHASMIVGNPDFELVALCDIKKKEELGLENFEKTLASNRFVSIANGKSD